MPFDDEIDETTEASAVPTLPPGTPCVYLRSAGDDIALFEAANAAEKDVGVPGVTRIQMAVQGVATDIDADSGRATIVALIDGALVTYPDRQCDPAGQTLGTWRKA